MKLKLPTKGKLAWLSPGLKFKRWILLSFLGIFLCIFSALNYSNSSSSKQTVYLVLLVLGGLLLIEGIRSLIASMVEALVPSKKGQIMDMIYHKRYLEKGPKVVVIGGGTGLSTMLSGIKFYSRNVTAIVTVADDGGSSGRLRREFDILPPGDIRNCLAALADDSDLMTKLFRYRFEKGEGVSGHSFGNLFITAMTEVTGSFDTAIEESSKILAIRGRVLPASLDPIRLRAEFVDGSTVEGETAIPEKGLPVKELSLLPKNARANQDAIKAIKEAELIVMGPGSLYTSVLPNLLIDEIKEAVEASEACKIYACNIMTQKGETDSYTASKHVRVLLNHCSSKIINHCIINHAACDTSTLLKYAKQHSFPVIPDREKIDELGVKVVVTDLISEAEYIRHDPEKLAKIIFDTFAMWKKNSAKQR